MGSECCMDYRPRLEVGKACVWIKHALDTLEHFATMLPAQQRVQSRTAQQNPRQTTPLQDTVQFRRRARPRHPGKLTACAVPPLRAICLLYTSPSPRD